MLTGNKGEWSEIYVLLKVLAEKKLFAGNSNLQRIRDVIYPVVEIIRTERDGELNFAYSTTGENVIIQVDNNPVSIPVLTFLTAAQDLLREILNAGKGTFEVPTIENFINSFGVNSLKARSTSKSDIVIKIHDARTGQEPTLGFSIKSRLGGNSTILNASQSTNFQYSINEQTFTSEQIEIINSIGTRSKIRDRLTEIENLGGRIYFEKMLQPVFQNNLTLIDSMLPKIIAESLIFYNKGLGNTLIAVVSLLRENNPLQFDLSSGHNFYEYKLKRLLTDVALGMMPNTVWTGQYDATGGYLVVKEDGEIVCYHIYDKNQFEEYLFENTRFETASSTRNRFGTIYTENGKQFINLNLQIRFI